MTEINSCLVDIKGSIEKGLHNEANKVLENQLSEVKQFSEEIMTNVKKANTVIESVRE